MQGQKQSSAEGTGGTQGVWWGTHGFNFLAFSLSNSRPPVASLSPPPRPSSSTGADIIMCSARAASSARGSCGALQHNISTSTSGAPAVRRRSSLKCTADANAKSALRTREKRGRARTLIVDPVPEQEYAPDGREERSAARVLAVEEAGFDAAEAGRRGGALRELGVEGDEGVEGGGGAAGLGCGC